MMITCEDGTILFNIELVILCEAQRYSVEGQVKHSPAERHPQREEEYNRLSQEQICPL